MRTAYRRQLEDPLYDAHPAIAAPMRLRIDYARVVASVASMDMSVGSEELESIRGLCAALGLPPGATQGVMLFAQEPTPERVRESVEALRDTDYALTLITDLVALAMSDGKYDIQERKQIHAVAAMMLVGEDQIAAIEDYVSQSLEGHEVVTNLEDVLDDTEAGGLAGEIAGSLAAACVPLAAVWANSPRGLSYTGVTRALDALGFGLGPLWGVAVAVSLGLLSYLTVRLTFRALVG